MRTFIFQKMTYLSLASLLVAVALSTTSASAAVLLSNSDFIGSRVLTPATPATDGITTLPTGTSDSHTWNDAFLIDWNISYDNGTGLYTYLYHLADSKNSNGTYNALANNLSHWLLETSISFTTANIFSGTSPSPSSDSPRTWTDQQGNPDIPGSLYGLKLDGPGTTFTLVTNRAPIWGDFYAKDGKFAQQNVVAYNTGFGTEPLAGQSASYYVNWIAVPDTINTTPGGTGDPLVPEPSSMIVWGMLGLAGVIAYRRRKID